MSSTSRSLFEQFSYRRKENVGSNASEKENKPRFDVKTITPNKAHPPAVTRVLETPDSLLPSPTSESGEVLHGSRRRRQQRRRRNARIVSSSEDDTPAQHVENPVKTSGLFSELPQSKRRKKSMTENQERVAKPSSETEQSQVSLWTLNLDLQNGGCVAHHPRRLFEGREKKREDSVGRIKLSDVSLENDEDSDPTPLQISAKTKGHKVVCTVNCMNLTFPPVQARSVGIEL